MASVTIIATDGSTHSLEAARQSLAVLAPADRTVLATVADGPDPLAVTGSSGFAGGTMSPEEFTEIEEAARAEAARVVEEARAVLGVDGAEVVVLHGEPGPALVSLADELDASCLVMGTRGRSGLARAFLGSVSDHVVRNAACPVIVQGGTPD